MSMYLGIGPVAALIAGVLILIVPRLLNYIVAVYLIVIGIIGLFGVPGLHYHGTSTSGHHAVIHLRTADALHGERSLPRGPSS
jgi:Protein of unknown function (DUF3096)